LADPLEARALVPAPVDPKGFNPKAQLPFGLTTEHVRKAMEDFIAFLTIVNGSLAGKDLPRLESILMAANFSNTVGDFIISAVDKHCPTLAKNRYHNGHPDLIERGRHPGDAIQYCDAGIEVKASRYEKAWQGHNAEDCWLMVFVFAGNGPRDAHLGTSPMPFRFVKVVGAQLEKADWQFAGRSSTSRRTITATVKDSGYQRMMANWIYRA
jgi:hypothetical protein